MSGRAARKIAHKKMPGLAAGGFGVTVLCACDENESSTHSIEEERVEALLLHGRG